MVQQCLGIKPSGKQCERKIKALYCSSHASQASSKNIPVTPEKKVTKPKKVLNTPKKKVTKPKKVPLTENLTSILVKFIDDKQIEINQEQFNDLKDYSNILSIFSTGDLIFIDPIKMFQNGKIVKIETSKDSKVKLIGNCSRMFEYAEKFNQDSKNDSSINNWDTSQVTNMSFMFMGALIFNQNIGSWDTSKVTNMFGMFHNSLNFNQDISNWDTSQVTDMHYMFENARNFNQNITTWDISKVTNMSFMFWGATSFNQDISNWKIGEFTNKWGMFGF